jgi:hypothetical protein
MKRGEAVQLSADPADRAWEDMMTEEERIERLRTLGVKVKLGRKISLTEEEGSEVIRAIRRGVGTAEIAETLNYGHRNNIYQRLGGWAIRYAKVD